MSKSSAQLRPTATPSLGSEAAQAPQRGGGIGNAERAARLAENFPFQEEMEALFGEDFSNVEVVFGATRATDALGTQAATQGERIQFASSSPDKEVVAHELAHVVQQRHSGGATSGVSSPDDSAEKEAEKVGKAAAAGQAVAPRSPTSAGTMRFTPAKEDKYNDPDVDNNGSKEGKDLRERPGVVYKKEDTFKITADTTMYYGSGAARTELKSGSEVCINPAEPRKIDGHTSLLVWAGTTGAGWVHAKDVENGYDLVRKVKYSDTYQDWQPSADNKNNDMSIFLFKTDGPTKASDLKKDVGDRVFPNQKSDGANKVSHHLMREGTKDGAEDDYYNVFMNLPQEKAAAVAYDVAKPGEEFHVPKDKDGHFVKRKVQTFDKGDDKNQGEVTFVFGYVAGNVSRRGWVVYECLERKG